MPADLVISELALVALRQVLADPDAPAAAKTQAARTLLEVEGLLGRHAPAPVASRQDLSTMTRAELLVELEAMRQGPGEGDTMRTQGESERRKPSKR
jgi:hypothetical protein